MKSFHEILRESREKNGLLLREVAAKLQIDQALISKFESGNRKPTREQVIQLARHYNTDKEELLVQWMSEKVVYELRDEEFADEILKVAEQKMRYLSKSRNEKA